VLVISSNSLLRLSNSLALNAFKRLIASAFSTSVFCDGVPVKPLPKSCLIFSLCSTSLANLSFSFIPILSFAILLANSLVLSFLE